MALQRVLEPPPTPMFVRTWPFRPRSDHGVVTIGAGDMASPVGRSRSTASPRAQAKSTRKFMAMTSAAVVVSGSALFWLQPWGKASDAVVTLAPGQVLHPWRSAYAREELVAQEDNGAPLQKERPPLQKERPVVWSAAHEPSIVDTRGRLGARVALTVESGCRLAGCCQAVCQRS